MINKRVFSTLSLMISATSLAALVGCSTAESPFKRKEFPIASNPASVHCAQQKGKLETVTENSQRVTYCVLVDGKRVEQWELYRQHQQQAESEK